MQCIFAYKICDEPTLNTLNHWKEEKRPLKNYSVTGKLILVSGLKLYIPVY